MLPCRSWNSLPRELYYNSQAINLISGLKTTSILKSTVFKGMLTLLILTVWAKAASWQIVLSSGEHFRQIDAIYIDETTVYLLPRGMAVGDLPIPVYLGDIKTIKRIYFNRFLGLSIGVYLGLKASNYFYNDRIEPDQEYQFSRHDALGLLTGLFLARHVCVDKIRLVNLSVAERENKIQAILPANGL